MATKDPVVEKERIGRLMKVRTLAGNIHQNRDVVMRAEARIKELEAEIERAEANEEIDVLALLEEAPKLGLTFVKQDRKSLIDALIGLLVELPRMGPAPAALPPAAVPMAPPWGRT